MLLIFGRNRMVAVTGALLLLIVIAIVVSHTHAGRPAGGATYSGSAGLESSSGRVIRHLPIAFSINATATRVQDFHFSGGLPSACADSGELAASSARISAPERFVARIPITTSSGRVGTASIAGNFAAFGRVIGAMTITYTSASLRHCDANAEFSAHS